MSRDYQELVFEPDGRVGFVFSDDLAEIAGDIIAPGSLQIRRASDVEPTADNQWTAIMRPWAGGKDLGTFPTRRAALDAEVEHLEQAIATGTLRPRRRRA